MTATQTASEFIAAAASRPLLNDDAARGAIAARLALLGHPPDFVDGQAVAALIDHAAGSPQRLRAALASTLFLASTEDAPQVGRALVNRALQGSEVQPASRVRPARNRLWMLTGSAAAVCLAVSTVALMLPTQAPTSLSAGRGRGLQPPLAPAASPARTDASAPRRSGVVPAPAPPTPRPAGPPPILAKQPPPAPPAMAVQTSPVPPPLVEQHVASPVVPPDILPDAPQATAILMYSEHDPAALSRLDDLVRRLRRAGIGLIETRAVPATRAARRPVSYFFADDYQPAQTISAVLLGQVWPRLQRNSLPPRLVLAPTGVALRHPGLIEVQLP